MSPVISSSLALRSYTSGCATGYGGAGSGEADTSGGMSSYLDTDGLDSGRAEHLGLGEASACSCRSGLARSSPSSRSSFLMLLAKMHPLSRLLASLVYPPPPCPTLPPQNGYAIDPRMPRPWRKDLRVDLRPLSEQKTPRFQGRPPARVTTIAASSSFAGDSGNRSVGTSRDATSTAPGAGRSGGARGDVDSELGSRTLIGDGTRRQRPSTVIGNSSVHSRR